MKKVHFEIVASSFAFNQNIFSCKSVQSLFHSMLKLCSGRFNLLHKTDANSKTSMSKRAMQTTSLNMIWLILQWEIYTTK